MRNKGSTAVIKVLDRCGLDLDFATHSSHGPMCEKSYGEGRMRQGGLGWPRITCDKYRPRRV